jgi:hypothetical protein
LLVVSGSARAAVPWPPPPGSADAKIYVIVQKTTELIQQNAAQQAQIDALQAALAAETAARIAADAVLQSNIDAEAAARQAADATLQSNIDAEAAARQAADATLQNNIDNEAAARQAADAVLQSNIDAEAAARQAGDATLQINIDNETAARAAADAALQAQIDALAAGGFRRLAGTGYTFFQTATTGTIASVVVPANTITDFIVVCCAIDQSSFNSAGSTAEIETQLLINGIARDTQSWTQTQSGVFVVTLSHSTYAFVYLPTPAEKAAALTASIVGTSLDGRTKNFNLFHLDVLGR